MFRDVVQEFKPTEEVCGKYFLTTANTFDHLLTLIKCIVCVDTVAQAGDLLQVYAEGQHVVSSVRCVELSSGELGKMWWSISCYGVTVSTPDW